MSQTTILIAVGACVVVLVIVALSLWSRSQALGTLRRWAASEGLEIMSATRRSFVPLWVSGKGYQFFRVTVRGQAGVTRRAWIRCWDFNSAEPHNIEVTWDDQSVQRN